MAVRCQQDLLFPSQTCRVFESDLPCFESELPGGFLSQIFRVLTQSLSGFFGLSWSFCILTLSFPFTESVLPFFESYISCFGSALLIFLGRTFTILTQSFPFIESVHPFFVLVFPDFESPTFWVNNSYFDSELPCFNDVSSSYFLGQSFTSLPILPFWFDHYLHCWQN